MEGPVVRVNINRASRDELLSLPGINADLASRIIENRPYTSLLQFRKACQIPKALYQEVKPFLIIERQPGPEPKEEGGVGEPLGDPGEPPSEATQADGLNGVGVDQEPAEIAAVNAEQAAVEAEPDGQAVMTPEPALEEALAPVEVAPAAAEPASSSEPGSSSPGQAGQPLPAAPIPEEMPAAPAPLPAAQPAPAVLPLQVAPPAQPPFSPAPPVPPPQPAAPSAQQPRANLLTRRELLIWVTATAMVTMVLSVILTLVVLSAINGTLSYVTPAQFNTLSHQVDTLNGQVKTLSTDLDGLRSRVDTLSSLSGRLDAVEKDAQAIHTQLDNSAKLVKEIQDQITGIGQSILDLQKSSQTFQNFLNGLRNLLTGTTQPGGGG